MNKLAVYLNKNIDGVVYSAPNILDKYSCDRSVLKYKPKLVAIPANVADVRRLVKFANQLADKGMNMPITVRGGGHSKTGTAIGSGIIMSTERLNHIQEIDTRQRLIRVQAGATLGEVQAALNMSGMELPVFGDPKMTIGGLIANCAPASVNTRPSTIIDFIEDMEVVIADGSLIQVHKITSSRADKIGNGKNLEARIHKQLKEFLEKNQLILDKVSEAKESRSWYSGIKDVCAKRGFNLAPIFCGSEGTLGVITEVILHVEPIFESPNFIAIVCDDIKSFEKATQLIEKEKFTDAIFYDTEIFADIEQTGKSLKFIKKAKKNGYLIVANAKDDSHAKRRSKIKSLEKKLEKSHKLIVANAENKGDFIAIHENLIAYLSQDNLESRVPVVDQVYIPKEKRVEFLKKLEALSDVHNMPMPAYGSIEYDTYTVRPKLRADDLKSYKRMIDFLRDYIAIVKECGGHVCGAAPEGRFLAPFIKAETNPAIIELNRKVKDIIDPNDIFNPGIKHEADARVIFKHFRTEYGGDLQSSY